MQKIHVLSQALSNQLAAGEVLERAASAVKELVENSLDAGADSIEIELDDGGKKRLCVSDNGCGMSAEDAKLSILRHATSKIHTTEDLTVISTMGFRGEALASMAAVSRMSILTQQEGDVMGTFLHVEGTEIQDCHEAAAPVGTQITLEDLFFNTPARLKFLKTTATELRRVYEVIEQFALACPEVHWKLTFDGRVKCDFPAHKTLKERALAVFGRALYEHLYPIDPIQLEEVTVDGLFCDPEYLGSVSGRLYTFVNRRIVKDRVIQSAISQAYKEFLHGKQPCVVLFVTIPLEMVDVNVHPTKNEVRFQKPDQVFHAVYRAVRHSLEKTPWIKSLGGAHSLQTQTEALPENLPDSAFVSPETVSHQSFGLPLDHAYHNTSRSVASYVPASAAPVLPAPRNDAEFFNSSPFTLTPEPVASEPEPLSPEPLLPLAESASPKGYFSGLKYIGQHALTYLICADGDNLVIIDQHAAHERVNYEKLRQVAESVLPPVSQGLLFPILLSLDTRLSDVLTEYKEFFEKIGFQIDEMGNHSHAIRAVPEALTGYDYAAMLRDALMDLADSGRAHQFEEIRDNILATMACHSSIRSGYKMTPQDVAELFRQMDETGFRSNCPHGRPVHFTMSLSELEKRFLRT